MTASKKFLSLCLAFLMAFSITACAAAPQADAASSAKGWTIFVYFCGSDLESDGGCASEDIEEICSSTYSDQVQVIIETGGASSWENNVDPDAIECYARTSDGMTLVDTQPAADMGDVKTLQSFLEWGVTNYPSEHMGLVFWNHGGGSISGVCFDENNDYDSLSVSEIGSALKSVAAKSGKFEFVGFDACLMATLETAYMLTPYANYMYASEELEPGTGWDYTTILNYLAENPNVGGAELGKVQCESYYACSQEDEEDPSITFSITDLSKIDALVTAFDQVSKELSESSDFAPVARGIVKADNFGGNNRTEGYTNMVDLADMLRAASDYVPSAKQALQALSSAVIYSKNGDLHANAGGLSLYYPLKVQGSQEISIFRDICPSTYYYALVAKLAGNADLSISSEGGEVASVNESDTLEVEGVYLDENGSYTVELSSMDEFAYASCCVYMDDGEGGLIYLGEDDDVIIDYDYCTIQDNFDGTWLWLEDAYGDEYLLPIELVSQDETMSLYVVSVLRNGEETNLQIVYDWDEGEYRILGTWDGVNSDTGMASRTAEALEDGDILNIVFQTCDDDGEWYTMATGDIEVSDDLLVYYDNLEEGDYYYAINLYDIYGNCYQLDYTTFTIDEYGDIYY